MATWYWVAATAANWNTTNWATSSGGSATGTPTTGDTAIFDGGSSATCTVTASVSVASLDCQGGTGAFAGTLAQNNGVTITISAAGATAFRLSSGMTYSPATTTSSVIFTNTSGTAGLTSAGQSLAALTINGAGGTVQQKDNLSVNLLVNAILTLTAGTFDCNTFALTVCSLSITGSTARALILGGTLTLGGFVSNNGTVFTAAVTTNLTFTKNSANIVILGPTSAIMGINVNFGNLTLNNVTFAATSTQINVQFALAFTCAALSVNPGWTLILVGSTTVTVSSAFTWVGTANLPISLMSNSGLGAATLSCPSGACTIQWGAIGNVTASGGATFAATDALLIGVAAGWTISHPVDASISPTAIATAIWQDLLSTSDFTTSGSIGALLKAISNLQFTVPAIGRGTCTTGGSTTSVVTSAFAPSGAVANQFAGRVILFDAATTTAALRGQVGTITASSNSATPTFTVSALTTAPASGDTFSVL